MTQTTRESAEISTDEWIDHAVSRPLAAGFVRLVARTPLTANQVTVLAGLTAIAASFGIARGTPRSLLLAAAGIVAFLVLDCADGQLARLRGGGSSIGRLLDGLGDYVSTVSLHVGSIVYLSRSAHEGFPALPTGVETVLVVVAGLLLAVRAGIYDDLKGAVRRAAEGAAPGGDEPERVRAEIAAERRPHVRALLRAYLLYCRLQASSRRVDEEPEPDALGLRVRALRGWSALGPSTHLIALAAAVALAARWPDAIRWYFLAAIGPATVAMLALYPLARKARR